MIMTPTTSMTMTPMTTTTTITITMMMMMMTKTIATRIKALAVNHDASPLGWSQIWSQRFSDAANHSRISTSDALPSLPWAQGVTRDVIRLHCRIDT